VAKQQFVTEKEVKCETLTQMRELITKDYKFDNHVVSLNHLSVTEDYKLASNGNELGMTRWAFDNLLRLLKIPVTFGAAIPVDLLEVIVNRLREVDPQGVKLYTAPEGDVVNITKATYRAPTLANILEPLQGDIKIGRLSVRGVKIATVIPGHSVEPEVGDVVDVGTILTASETGGPAPKANLMTFRLICSNGAVAGDILGTVRYVAQGGNGYHEFINRLGGLNEQAGVIAEGLTRLPGKKVTDVEFSRMWNQVRILFDTDTTDGVFKVDKEVRKQYLAQAIVKKKELIAPSPTDLSAWEVFNSITFLAKDLDYVRNDVMMKIGGSLLN